MADAERVSFRVAYGRRRSEFGIVAWSPDGKWIAAAGGSQRFQEARGDGLIWFWRPDSDESMVFEGHTAGVRHIAWSPDSRNMASGSDDATVRLWDVDSRQERHVLRGHSGPVEWVAWSPDGSRVATGDSQDDSMRLWDAANGREIHTLHGEYGSFVTLAWSPDGELVAGGSSNRTVRVWSAGSGRERHVLRGHSDWIASIAWSPDGRVIASASEDKTVRLWDAFSGAMRHTLEGHSWGVHCVAWSPDGRTLASGSGDNTVLLWDPSSGVVRYTLEGHSAAIRTVAWSPDGKTLASGSLDGTVKLWEAGSGRGMDTLSGDSSGVLSVSWSPDGRILASGSGNLVQLWDVAAANVRTLHGNSEVSSVAWSMDGNTAAGGCSDGTVRLWDARSGKERHRLRGHSSWVWGLAWPPDGNSVASSSSDGTVRLWDADRGREERTFRGHRQSVHGLAWSPDGKSVASSSNDATLALWDAVSGRELRRLQVHADAVASVAWSPDGTMLAGGSWGRNVRLWDAFTGDQIHLLRGHSGRVRVVAWSPDGATVASGSWDKTVRMWDATSGREKLVLEGHEFGVTHLAWSRDGRVVVSCDARGAIRIWDSQHGKLLDETLPRAYRYVTAGIEAGTTPGWDNGDLIVSQVSLPFATGAAKAKAGQVLQATAKVVLAGDSNAGKSCLARRLAEDAYVEGQPTTHGMQIWTLPPEKLDEDGRAPEGQLREIFLWDLGGQDEYQLVNQLFLRETAVALVLFDATRGPVGLKSAQAWDERLSAQAATGIRKLLIQAKADMPGVVRAEDVEALRKERAFRKAIAVSAKQDGDEGVARLRRELHDAIDWGNVAPVSRPEAFHDIRKFLADARQSGRVILFLADLERQLAAAEVPYQPGELETTLFHLVREGQIADVVLQSGDRALVLRIDVISRYAGSLVQAARTDASRAPALAQDHVLSAAMQFPGLEPGERLQDRSEERTVLECVVRLMVERGLCFDHQGLLVFPTLFDDLAEHEGKLPPSAPVYYDFSGPIDNIYASLVARLTVSGRFGPVRLWARYAEFGSEAEGKFGIRRADRSKGRGHVDLYLSGPIEAERQRLFRDFVDDHLESHGVKILSGLAFSCACGFAFAEDLLADRLAEGKAEVGCPRCDRKYSLFASAQAPTAESQRKLSALKTDIDARTRESANKVVEALSRPKEVTAEPLVILHLSDLHFTAEMNVDSLLQPLESDLRRLLGGKGLDYLVISGDFADKCNEKGWALAAEFVTALREGFGPDALRIVLAPGNHDLMQGNDYFNVELKRMGTDAAGKPVVGGEPIPNEKYPTRFHRFATFYHNLYSAKAYPENPDLQFDLIEAESGFRFLALNSAWQIDQYYPERASLNNNALSKALRKAGKVPLGVAVWHHAAAGDRKIADTDATKRLADAGFRIVLHGDVHIERDDALHYLDDARRIHVIGCGSFGAKADQRPESTPRSYTLLRVHRDLRTVEVERRYQRTAESPYETGPRHTLMFDGLARDQQAGE